ncbi:MAG: hypothetical protein ACK5YO_03090, partial [Planctomyces sp.]
GEAPAEPKTPWLHPASFDHRHASRRLGGSLALPKGKPLAGQALVVKKIFRMWRKLPSGSG